MITGVDFYLLFARVEVMITPGEDRMDTAKKSSNEAKRAETLVDHALLLGLIVLLLALTWGRWPDILRDFGRELYIPWQLTAGKVLYCDLAYLNGPLSPYYHALLFSLFGVNSLVLIASNVIILFLVVSFTYGFVQEMADRKTAQIAAVIFLILFAFGHLTQVGNYNFITPYSHELTHGLLLILVLMLLLLRFGDFGRVRDLIGAGLVCGLIFLTKVEVFLAALAVVLVWLLPPRSTPRWRLGVSLAMAALIPVAAFGAFLMTHMEWLLAWHGLAGGWGHLLATSVGSEYFYRQLAGFHQPFTYARRLLTDTVSLLIFVAAAAGFDYYRHHTNGRLAPWLGVGLVIAILLRLPLPPILLGTELPLLALASLIVAVVSIRDTTPPLDRSMEIFLLWSALSFTLLLRMGLRPWVGHYGFVLAMPATLLCLVLFLYHLPRFLTRSYGGGQTCRWWLMVWIVLSVTVWVTVSGRQYYAKTVWAGSGGEAVRTYTALQDPISYGLAQATTFIADHTPPDSTLVVLPEGVLVNYLTRRRNPTPYVSFIPVELVVFGQEAMLTALERSKPDYLMVVERDLREYGQQFFGMDSFGKGFQAWIDQNYRLVAQFGPAVRLYQGGIPGTYLKY